MPSRTAARGLRVLLVEDDEGVRRSTQLLLEWNGFEVRAHTLAASAIALPDLAGIHLLVADYVLPDGDGIKLLTGLHERGWRGRAVLITGNWTQSLDEQAKNAGFAAVLEKPVPRHALIGALTK